MRLRFAIAGTFALLIAGVGAWEATGARPDGGLVLVYPIDGTRYPPNLAPPTWSWRDPGDGPWRVTVGEGAPEREVDSPRLTLDAETWRSLAATTSDEPRVLRVCGAQGACAEATFGWSTHPFEGSLTYRLVQPPFGSDRLYRTELKRQAIDAEAAQPLAPGLPSSPCLGCHAVSPRGRAAVQVRDPYDPRVGILDVATGSVTEMALPDPPFGRCSGLGWAPDGALVVAMNLRHTDERFDDGFRLTHHASDLARVEPDGGGWALIPGASDPALVEDFPAVSPDGATLAFVRGREIVTDRGALDVVLLDLAGEAAPEPLAGASGDGRASYFPRFSPDGRWIAFVRSDGGYFARPSSDLYLVSTAGGEPRRLGVNTHGRMDSWPSWSLDGHWLVWASRRDDPDHTRAYLTEVDDEGRCSPPVPFPGEVPAGFAVNHPMVARAP
jgi:hypothetical protein